MFEIIVILWLIGIVTCSSSSNDMGRRVSLGGLGAVGGQRWGEGQRSTGGRRSCVGEKGWGVAVGGGGMKRGLGILDDICRPVAVSQMTGRPAARARLVGPAQPPVPADQLCDCDLILFWLSQGNYEELKLGGSVHLPRLRASTELHFRDIHKSRRHGHHSFLTHFVYLDVPEIGWQISYMI